MKRGRNAFTETIHKIERPGTLQALVYDKIKDFLVTGQLEFGAIYSVNRFADILGVSRTPVRESVLKLAAEGLPISIHGRGFKIRGFSKKEIGEFFEVRKMIETYVIERSVGLLTEQDLKQMDDSLRQMISRADKEDIYSFLEADKTFHMSLVYRMDNLVLESIMENIRNLISIFGKKALASSGRFREVINEHQSILQALYQKDKEKAIKALNCHLNATEKHLIENLHEPDYNQNKPNRRGNI